MGELGLTELSPGPHRRSQGTRPINTPVTAAPTTTPRQSHPRRHLGGSVVAPLQPPNSWRRVVGVSACSVRSTCPAYIAALTPRRNLRPDGLVTTSRRRARCGTRRATCVSENPWPSYSNSPWPVTLGRQVGLAPVPTQTPRRPGMRRSRIVEFGAFNYSAVYYEPSSVSRSPITLRPAYSNFTWRFPTTCNSAGCGKTMARPRLSIWRRPTPPKSCPGQFHPDLRLQRRPQALRAAGRRLAGVDSGELDRKWRCSTSAFQPYHDQLGARPDIGWSDRGHHGNPVTDGPTFST